MRAGDDFRNSQIANSCDIIRRKVALLPFFIERTLRMIIINDLHLSANRVGGTTPQSREDLRTFIFDQFEDLLEKANGHDLCILGDLFDGFEVAPRDWLETYMSLATWCANNLDSTLYLVAGNHDVSMKGSKVSSFETLATVLDQQFDNVQVVGIDSYINLYLVDVEVFIVAHHRNQDVFDLSMKDVLNQSKTGDYVLLHANYDNKFAEQADHSLNVSAAQALEFTKKGVTLVFAHEHQHRGEIPHGTPANGGTVVCLGNQIPTSISDVFDGGDKFYWELSRSGLQKQRCWHQRGDFGYQALDWQDLGQDCPAKFIRVVGDATNAEAAQVIDAIHKFRQRSKAYVITNAVRIDGIAEMDDLPSTFEVAKKFDVMDFVYKQLDAAEVDVIRKIVGEME